MTAAKPNQIKILRKIDPRAFERSAMAFRPTAAVLGHEIGVIVRRSALQPEVHEFAFVRRFDGSRTWRLAAPAQVGSVVAWLAEIAVVSAAAHARFGGRFDDYGDSARTIDAPVRRAS